MNETTYPIPVTRVSPDLPSFPLPEGFDDAFHYLKHLVAEGATRLYGDGIHQPVSDRIEHELAMIDEVFANYLLIIWDLVRMTEERYHLMMGPGRGSTAGSMVCYCIGITQVDPLKHGLLFERFCGSGSLTMPAIDLDCEDGAKEKMVAYLKEKYGDRQVSNVIVYKRENGAVVSRGIHASGVALSRLPIDHYAPLTQVDGTLVPVYDHRCIRDAGPVMINILELSVLNKLHGMLRHITDRQHLDLESLPLDDPQTLEAFVKGETEDVFLFSSPHLCQYLKRFESLSFEDLVAIHTLYRPEQMKLMEDFYARHSNGRVRKNTLPCMVCCLEETRGLLLYQEQLMLLLAEIAGFSGMESERCRKALHRRDEAQLAQYKKIFVEGGIERGHPPLALERIWEDWRQQGTRLFNKSHAVCYTLIAYQMMYLKVHFDWV